GKSFSGTGTFFSTTDEGACETPTNDDDLIVALNSEQYGNTDEKSPWCGKKVKITVGKKTAEATISDACPECKFGDLDMTATLFKKLGDLDTGELDIKWQV
ncbi:hypothetical protein K492DRAFT_109642, partial [Lichtheimia hyalospora FSU 10163]